MGFQKVIVGRLLRGAVVFSVSNEVVTFLFYPYVYLDIICLIIYVIFFNSPKNTVLQ